MMRVLFYGIIGFCIAWYFWPQSWPNVPPGIVAPHAPMQSSATTNPFPMKDFIITPIATYDITARILGRNRYYLGTEANISPIDLALGWQHMSDIHVLRDINISQGHRWYKWYTSTWPIERNTIETESANTHIIPADETIRDQIFAAKRGDVVHMRGFLVQVDNPDTGWHWVSSTTRSDIGEGACELFYVTSFERKS